MRLHWIISLACTLSSSAFAGQYMNAHFCQPYQHGGLNTVELYYQSQGSIYAAKDTTVVCPINMQNNNAQQHVKLYYQSAHVAGNPAVACTFWKIMSSGLTTVSPQVKSQPNLNAGSFDIYSPNGSTDTIGMSLQCNLKAGAKILSYYVY
jgi:hypothetical protein